MLRLVAVRGPVLPAGELLTGVAASGPRAAFALAQTDDVDNAGMPLGGAALFRFDGGWSVVPLPGTWRLTGLASGGGGSVWAVGEIVSAGRGSFAPLVAHWTGGAWRRVLLPASLQAARPEPGMNSSAHLPMLSVTAASGDRVWLRTEPTGWRGPLLYDGGNRWQERSSGSLQTNWVANLGQRPGGPWLAVAASDGELDQVAYGSDGAVWAWGRLLDQHAPGGFRYVLFRLSHGRLVPIAIPLAKLGSPVATADFDPTLAVDPADDPVLIVSGADADRVVYATYAASRGWQIRIGPAHAGAIGAWIQQAAVLPGSGAFLAVGDAKSAAGGWIAVVDAAGLAGARPVAVPAAQSIVPPSLAPGWQAAHLPTGLSPPVQLMAVSAAGPGNALAGGAQDVGSNDDVEQGYRTGQPLILRWNGSTWSRQRVETTFTGGVTAIAAGQAGVGWAIAVDQTGACHLLYGTDGVWRQTSFPGQNWPGLRLTSIAAAPDGSAWVTGASLAKVPVGTLPRPLILHWTGDGWHEVPAPVGHLWPVQVTATTAGTWVAGQVPDHTFPLHWDPVVARRTASGWLTLPWGGGAPGSTASSNGTIGGTLGLAVSPGGGIWILVARAQPAIIGGPPPTGAVAPSPPLLLHWSAGSWAQVRGPASGTTLVGGGAMPVLLSAGQLAGFRTAPAPVPGFIPDGWGWLDRPTAGYGQVTTVPGSEQLWAVGRDWIARYG